MTVQTVSRRAFTVIELLVVIAIIGLLVSITLVVGSRVVGSGKKSATEQTLKILDSALSAYIAERGANPSPIVDDPRIGRDYPAGQARAVLPVADAQSFPASGSSVPIDSVGLFLLQMKGVSGAESAIAGIDAKYLRGNTDAAATFNAGTFATLPNLRTVLDGWGNPIRYVHPAYKGAINDKTYGSSSDELQPANLDVVIGRAKPGTEYRAVTRIRRSAVFNTTTSAYDAADADAGSPPADRPYFYSAGADGNPATTEDNVYLTQPKLPKSGS